MEVDQAGTLRTGGTCFELKFSQLMEEGKYAQADHWHARLAPYMAMFHGAYGDADRVFHAAALTKASLEYVGLYGGPLRPPHRAMNSQEKKGLWAIMDQMGVKKGEQVEAT
jgi:dihydrodipicolinate synthase/N-acetylneuraminate lyase